MRKKIKNKKGIKNSEKPYQQNFAQMAEFIHCLNAVKSEEIKGFQEKYLLNYDFMQENKPISWSPNEELVADRDFIEKLPKEIRDDFSFIVRNMNDDFKAILKEIKMPIHFYKYIWDYIVYGIINAPSFNFKLSFQRVDPKADYQQSAIGGMKSVSINIYSPLSTKEKEVAFKLADGLSKLAFPKHIKKSNATKNIYKNIEIAEQEMKRPKKKIELGDYLERLKKSGQVSENIFNETKKINRGFTVVKEKGISSKMIAKKYKTTPANIRKIKERMKKKAKTYFN